MTGSELRDRDIQVVAIVGATATGKTTLGVELALAWDGEVVNADSRQFYRGMDIGTAKPTSAERRGVRHHLVDTLDPHENYSLNDFLRAANEAIADIHKRGKLPVIVGGSGQYIWGLLEGWEVPEIPPNQQLRKELEAQLAKEGIEPLQRRLRATGAENIDRVEVLNPRRLIRAIERAVATGDAMGGASKSETPPYDALIIGLKAPREVLHDRVAARLDEMIDAGWVEEVKSLLGDRVTNELPSMSAIGYRQLAEHIEGRKAWEETREEILIGSHRLIGAQHNWFKPRDPRIRWLDITDECYPKSAYETVRAWLKADG